MARCKDCIHNDLCKEMHKFGLVDLPYNDNAICDLFKSSADVVPKSEVDLLVRDLRFKNIECNQLRERITKAKQEVAREIFEEIDEELNFLKRAYPLHPITRHIIYVFAELKKKYTESES